jgi:hypothetical protein
MVREGGGYVDVGTTAVSIRVDGGHRLDDIDARNENPFVACATRIVRMARNDVFIVFQRSLES